MTLMVSNLVFPILLIMLMFSSAMVVYSAYKKKLHMSYFWVSVNFCIGMTFVLVKSEEPQAVDYFLALTSLVLVFCMCKVVDKK